MFVAVLRVPLFYVKGTFHVSFFNRSPLPLREIHFAPVRILLHLAFLRFAEPPSSEATPRREAWACSRRDTFVSESDYGLQVLFSGMRGQNVILDISPIQQRAFGPT